MKVYLLASENNQHERNFLLDLQHKIAKLGYETIISAVSSAADLENLLSADIVAVVFDGRDLRPADYVRLGIFYQHNHKEVKTKLLVGYSLTKLDVDIKPFLDHLAKTELNLISCLKDYLYLRKSL